MTPEEIVREIIAQSETMSRPVYRGQANAGWQPLSGAVRRLRDAHGDDFPSDDYELRQLVSQYQKERLIIPMEIIDGADLSDLQRLSILQHQGAATGLLDFTEQPLIALWFMCAEMPEENGRVFMLDIGDHQVALNARQMTDPFDAGSAVVYYEPDRSLGARIIAQQSVFVICNPKIPDQFIRSIEVPRASKTFLRKYLTNLGLSETTLFGDIPGLAAANTTRIRLQQTGPLSPGQYRDRGNRAFQSGRYNDALSAYQSYAEAMPNVAQPYCLKGNALTALGRFEEAKLAYTQAIENLDQPLYLDGKVIINRDPIGNIMSRSLYYNRANIHAVSGDHSAAVADFDSALQYGYYPKRNLLLNRGNSKLMMEMVEEAHEDFEAAWSEGEGSDAALAMGNCKVALGEFEEALRRYLDGSAAEPENPSAHCQQNAEQVRQILEALSGHDYRVRKEGLSVLVETTCANGIFPFVGNQGNTGNVPSGMVSAPGGKGYEGMVGFAVVFVRPTSSH